MCTYDLKYNDYNSNVSDGLRSLLATSDISDITLAVEGKFFKAHQVILSIFSPYFRELFCVNPSKHTIFFMKNVKYRIMHNLLAFMYEGMVQIPEEDFNLFWETANELKIKGLSSDGEPHSEAKVSQVPVLSAPVVGIDAQQHADENPPKLTSSLKRLAESVQASPPAAAIKKSKVGIQVPHEPAPEVNVLSSAVPSTSWDPAPLVCVQEVLPIIVNVTGEANIPIKQEVEHYAEENTSHCMQTADAIDLDGSSGDATCDIKWEPEEVPVGTMLDPLGDMDVRHLGVNEGHSVRGDMKSNSLSCGAMRASSSIQNGFSPAIQHQDIDQKFWYIVEQLQNLQEQNKQILHHLNPRAGMSFQPFDSPVSLPMQTFDDIMGLEEYLKNVNNFNNVISYLTSLGGTNATSSTNLILKRCLTNQNASEWNFLGKGAKKPFSSLLLCRAIVAAVLKRQPGSTETEINGHIKVWLKHAPQRLKGMEKKAPAVGYTLI